MLYVMQMEVGGFDLLRRDPRIKLVNLVQQGGDFPCIGIDIDIVDAESEENFVGKVHARFVDQRVCHDGC